MNIKRLHNWLGKLVEAGKADIPIVTFSDTKDGYIEMSMKNFYLTKDWLCTENIVYGKEGYPVEEIKSRKIQEILVICKS